MLYGLSPNNQLKQISRLAKSNSYIVGAELYIDVTYDDLTTAVAPHAWGPSTVNATVSFVSMYVTHNSYRLFLPS